MIAKECREPAAGSSLREPKVENLAKGASASASSAFGNRVLPDLLEGAAARFPDRVALDFHGRCWRYGELGELVTRAARGLQDLGLRKGDRLGLCLPNTPFFVVLYFAALRIGAVVVNFNPLYAPAELVYQIRDSGTRMLVVPDVAMIHDKVVRLADEAGLERIITCPMADIMPPLMRFGWRLLRRDQHARLPEKWRAMAWADLIARDVPPDPVPLAPDDLAVLQYTGGTTGVPKGAMLTHGNLTANAMQMLRHVGDTEEQQRTLGVLPMFHVFALTAVLNFSILVAAEIVLLARFDMEDLLHALKRKPPTQFFGVPTLYVAINALPAAKLPDLSGLRGCVSGGAPLPHDVRETFEALTHGKVVEGYGLTEASPIIACNPIDGLIKPDSCGPAFPGTVLEIRDLEDPSRILGVGEKGEVCARGPQVMRGYWQRPDETAKCFVDGALRTGDVGYIDEDGYLFLVDRIKDVILCGGYNVYPRVIEEAAYAHPAVLEAVAIAIPDAYRGQSPKLFVTLREGEHVSTEDLMRFLDTRLSRIEVPRALEFRASLPKTQIGKIARKELVEEERLRREAKSDGGAVT